MMKRSNNEAEHKGLLFAGISALLFLSTFLTVISRAQTIVYADNDKTISGLCTGAINNPEWGSSDNPDPWKGNYVYYGTYNERSVKYRVLTRSTTDFGGKTMLLDCDNTLIDKEFDPSHPSSPSWAGSELKTWLNGDGFYNGNVFTEQEKNAIKASIKSSDTGAGEEGFYFQPLTGEKVFILDAKEALNPSYGYEENDDNNTEKRKKLNMDGVSNSWWLRSSTSESYSASDVARNGNVNYYEANNTSGVSPAFNLSLESVIFSSVISGNPQDIGAEYKLTVADNNLGITPKAITRSGTTITVPYTITGTDLENATQVSVLITDKAYSAGTALTSGYTYLKLNVTPFQTTGTGTFTLPDAYAGKVCGTDYYAYILAEDVNAGYSTDYACTPVAITIPDAVATPTFSPEAGTYADAQSVTISCKTSGATIHYTTDGTTPTVSGEFYTSPIRVSETTTIKAIAVKSGMADSSVASAKYTISGKPVAVTGVSVSPEEVTLKPDAARKLTATVEPDDATNKDVTWRSDDEDIATVSDDGTVTAVSEGETTITVTTVDGNKSATCTVIVKKNAPVVETCIISFDANGGKGDMDDQTVDKGVKIKLNKNKFTRSGYSFDGWNTDPDGDGNSFGDKDDIRVEKDTTLYAQWEKDEQDHEETEEPAKPAAINPDTVEGFFAVGGQPVPGVVMAKTVQGAAAQSVLNLARPAGFLQAFTFNMAINGKVDHTFKHGVLMIMIPKEFQKEGRTFAIMALDKNGKTWIFADTDTNPVTVTADINFEGYAFALIYKD